MIVVLGVFLFFKQKAKAPEGENKPIATNNSEVPATEVPASFNKNLYSLDDPASLWIIVNKKRPLPDGYTPADLVAVSGQMLRKEAATALGSLLSDGAKAGASMQAISGYRSQATQVGLYNSYVAKDGVAAADRYSARPRYSEHQTGLAADLGNGTCDLEICFGTTAAGKWLRENAYRYGFVVRYPEGKESLTGYQYEPWHIRYVGKELALEIQKSGQTLEQFFGLPMAGSY